LIAAALAVLPGTAGAKLVELGSTATPIASPVCPKGVSPSQCFIILTRTTAVQSISDGLTYPTTVKQDGWVVAFTVGLSKLSTNVSTERNYLHILDRAYGGTPQLALTVLKPGPRSRFTVAAQSQTFHLIHFLGSVLQEPLALPPSFTQFTALPVKKGEVIGLTVPTWAPVLSYNLNASKFSYRQSRMANCTHAAGGQTAQLTVGSTTQYQCSYTGTRVEYSVTEVVNTHYPRSYVH
ncbi:MAG: hypothetical protein M3010_02385, partial [Candidatus Dormibacteraeota bacterium]|nr:hypothetical protein [Candidatus Dormibacteraeota bacterium]